MKTLFLLQGLLFIHVFSSAQQQKVAPKMPVDETTKLITYTKVVEAEAYNKDTLFTRALDWCNTYYKNPADVIREADSTGDKIVCKARFKISNPADKKEVVTDAGAVMYTLNLEFRDGRYKYEVTEINWKMTSYYPIERWMDTGSDTYKPVYDYYLQQVDEKIKEMLKDLDKAMHAKVIVKKDNW